MQIIKGIRSADVQTENVLRDLINKMFPGLAKQAKQPIPPRRRWTHYNWPTRSLSGSGVYNNNPKKVAEHVHFNFDKASPAEKTAVKHLLFLMQNG